MAALSVVVMLVVAATGNAASVTPTAAEFNATPSANWISTGGGLTGQRYSALDQINKTNVANLKEAWHVHLDGSGVAGKYSAEGSPTVYDGVMYIPTGNNDIFALDAATGKQLWKFESKIDQNITTICCGWDARGIGFGDGKVFSSQLDGVVVALDAATGKELWRTVNLLWQEGYSMTGAPVYNPANNLVYVGSTGGEFRSRGSITAYNATTGARAWRFYTCPDPGDIGGATWTGEEYRYCGATVWSYPAVDPDLNQLYFTTSNAAPWSGRGPGQNLFSASIVALNATTGNYVWHFQQVHHDIWDYDCPSPPLIFDVSIGGQTRKGLGEACKTGWVYLLDRTNGTPLVGIVERKVPQNKYNNTWPTQPYPVGDAFADQCADKADFKGKAPDGKKFKVACIFTPFGKAQFVAVAPGALGGTNWPPMSYNQKTSYVYVCSGNTANALKAIPAIDYEPGQNFIGVQFANFAVKGGSLTAIDVRTNKIAWQQDYTTPCYSGSMTTGGGLTFAGVKNDGTFAAYDASTGAELWTAKLDAGANAPGVSYSVNGKQYVAIYAGGSAFIGATGFGGSIHGDSVYAFSLG